MSPKKSTAPRPFRSLGLSLAILAVFFFFGFIPLIPALFVILLRLQGRIFEPVSLAFWLAPALGLLTMVVCVFAWLGRPPYIRILFLACTVLSAALSILFAVRPELLNFIGARAGGISYGSSLDGVLRGTLQCLLPLRLFVLAYVLWYVNRPPSRAFYDQSRLTVRL